MRPVITHPTGSRGVLPNRLRRAALVGAVVLGTTGSVLTLGPAATAASAGPARIGQAPAVPGAAVSDGSLPGSTVLTVDVTLEPRDPAALSQFATAVSTPGNPLYGHYLAAGQFPQVFGPTSGAISAVESALTAAGLHPGAISANHLLIPVTATAGQLASAFSTGFGQYRLGGRLVYANATAPRFAAAAAPFVQGVVGLDNLFQPQRLGLVPSPHGESARTGPHVATGGPQPCTTAVTDGPLNDAYTADQIASAYQLPSLYGAGDLGAGQTIGIFELEPDKTSDIAAYQSCYGTSATVTYTKVDGGSGTGAGQGEAALDIEQVIGLAPKAAVDVYQGPNSNTGLLQTYTQIQTADAAKAVTTSWGDCESEDGGSSVYDAEDTIFTTMASQGQSMYAAAGDSGSEDCGGTTTSLAVDDPGTQPYVTSVGGTTLSTLGPPPTETVWNESSVGGGAGGGGVSTTWTMPSYQSSAPAGLNVINANSSGSPCGAPSGTDCREVPDVSANADPYTGYLIYYSGSWTGIGGTSAAAPLWAAFTALTDASAACTSTSQSVGFANPKLYTAAGTSGYHNDFNDITSGNNDYTNTNGGLYPAGVGYDMASGLGTPDGQYLPGALCPGSTPAPVITAVSPSSGTTAGGTSVTITGTNLASATSVKFGTATASVVSDTATQIVATTPAGSAGAVGVSVTTGGGTTTDAGAFTYVTPTPAPTITAVSPSSGTTAGGTSVTITGTNLGSATSVKFGTATASVVSDTATQIVATTPAGSAGAVGVSVTTGGGTTTDAGAFTYVTPTPAPTITAVSPSSGTTAGGTSVTITGTNLGSATSVKFGTGSATVTTDTATQIVATTPPGNAGAVGVSVTTGGGTTTDAGAFTYVTPTPAPTITSVSPTTGSTAGGTSVTITGTNLGSATAVKFGTGSATVTTDTATQIVATTPPGNAGAVGVSVTTGGGTTTDAGAFTYVTPTPAPTITSVSPTTGSTAGGTSVTITGTNLGSATSVKFGTGSATVTTDTATQIVATTPPGNAGAVGVSVTTGGGTTTDAGAFTYVTPTPAPTITAVSPSSGTTAGGTSVTITGTNLGSATTVKFGTGTATVTTDTATQIVATTPAGSAGAVGVSVTTAGGTTTDAGAFTYVAAATPPTVTNVSANSGTHHGGQLVLIFGTNFSGVSRIQFGAGTVTTFEVLSSGLMVAITPSAAAAGVVDVRVTTGAGTSAVTSADHYTYT